MSAYRVSPANRRIILLAVMSMIASLLTINFNAPGARADSELAFFVAAGPTTVSEGVGTVDLTLEVSSTGTFVGPVTFDITPSGTEAADYSLSATSFNFAAAGTQTLTVTINDDNIYEGDESLVLDITNVAPGTANPGTNASHTINITENETPPSISVAASMSVGEVGPNAAVVVTKTGVDTETAIGFSYGTTDTGSAGAGTDYTTTNGSDGSIATDGTSATINVPILDDLFDEVNETFLLTISAPSSNATIGNAQITVTITDDDAPATIDIDDSGAGEAAGTMSFTVNRVGTTENEVTFDYDTTNGTATAGSDYTAVTSGSGTIAAGTNGSTTVTVPIIDDAWDDEAETFTVTISGESSNVTITDPTATGTIADDDAVASISIDDLTFDEDVGTANFVVNRTGTTEGGVTFDYDTTGGSATSGTDFTAVVNGSGSLPAGTDGSTTVGVLITDDPFDDDGESFTVTISGETSNVTISDAVATGNITDNDGAPTISISNATFNEGIGTASFTVSRSGSTAGDVTFDYATSDGTALAGSDYTAVTSGSGTIPAGTDGGTTVTVDITDDPRDENDQSFNVTISGASLNVTIDVATALGTIEDNDAPPVLTLTSDSGNEAVGDLTFTATLSVVSELDVTATANSVDVTTEPADYSALASTPVTITAGDLTTDILVSVLDDAFYETTETFTVNLTGLNNASGTPSGTGTITNNDAVPVVTISDETEAENAGQMTFTITRTGFTEIAVAGTADTVNGTATAPSDYTAVVAQAVGIPADLLEVATTTVIVDIIDNAIDETLSEIFTLDITGITGATPVSVTGTGSITDDDGEPALSIDDVIVTEGGTATFTVTRVGETALPITVTATTGDDTAIEPGDYDDTTEVLNIGVGNTTTTFDVDTNNDSVDEDDEDFEVTLSSPTNAVIADGTGVGTITDTDAEPVLSINNVTVDEDAGSMVFTITRTGGTEKAVTVSATTFDDTAVAGADYGAKTESVPIPSSGATNTATFSVDITDDPLVEVTETLEVELSGALNATIGDTTGVGTITDNDVAGVIIIESDGNTSVLEGGLTDDYTVELAAQPSEDVTVEITTDAQTTTSPTSLTFTTADWDTPQTVSVTADEDGIDEPDPHSGVIQHSTTSLQTPFNGLAIPNITVIVGDADSLLVTIDGPSVGAPGLTSTFDAMVNAGGTGTITYEWTAYFGGDPVDTGNTASFDFTPTEGGIYLIEAIVGDSKGENPAEFIQFRVLGDIGTSIFVEDIVWLAEEGITRGCNPPLNTEYCPTQFVTREQMAAFLVRFLGLTDDGGGNKFVDDDNSIFQDDIAKLAAAGITRGCNPPANTNFCPTDRVTREQMAAFLVRALELTDNGGGNNFVDDDDSIFQEEIARLAAAGITRGCNPPANTNFCPTQSVTRGQMAAFLRRADAIVNP